MGRSGGGLGSAEMDPVRSFERWKKKYTRRTKRLRLQRKERKRPEWQVEREGIGRLVQRYPEVRQGRAVLGRDGSEDLCVAVGGKLLVWCVWGWGCEEEEKGSGGPGQGWRAPVVGSAIPLAISGARRQHCCVAGRKAFVSMRQG